MKIENSTILMTSKSKFSEQTVETESLILDITKNNTNSDGLKKDTFVLSDETKNILDQLSNSKLVDKTHSAQLDDTAISDSDKRKLELLEAFIQRLTGKKFKFVIPKKLVIENPDINIQDTKNLNSMPQMSIPEPKRLGWSLDYQYHYSHHEAQSSEFKAIGNVTTADGKKINFSLNLTMSREFTSNIDINLHAGDPKIDPLVINYENKLPSLSDKKYSFDINYDGTKENISIPQNGSGFLALDINNDNIINDGNELFGPQSGNGFEELKKYDLDHNNWIDENDAVYDKLKIWTKDSEGKDYLFAIGEKGIGAIFLGNVSTTFNIKDSENVDKGQIKSTGIFLKEDGTVGTVQHIDISV